MRFRCLIAVALTFGSIASCHTSYRPFELADSCHCGPNQYCRIGPSPSSGAKTTMTECLPFPKNCTDPPTCACLGRPVDACREELGRFWVFERRSVPACDECSSDEYCLSTPAPSAPQHLCGLLPPQCEEEVSCACFLRIRRHVESLACDDSTGRIEVSLR